jgi:AAA domain-containing protein
LICRAAADGIRRRISPLRDQRGLRSCGCDDLDVLGGGVGELIIVTGPPGAGKSSVSGLVADSFDSSVLIPGDWFFSLWHRGAISPWLPQALPQTSVAARAAAAAAGAFARADCRVVYDGFIPPGDLAGFAAAAGLSVLHYAVILPPAATTCADRVASRTGHGFTSVDATRAMHRDFAQATLDARHLITDAGAAPEDVARQILDGLAAGSFQWRAPGGRPPDRHEGDGESSLLT